MIAIINYGLGNVLAFYNIYKKAGIAAEIVSNPDGLRQATRIVLPGVGAFDHAMALFEASGLRGPVESAVLERKLPILGICVGMQMLARDSEEGTKKGLCWIPGSVRRIDTSKLAQRTRLPHMGWNTMRPLRHDSIFNGLGEEPEFYFLHSYYFQCDNAEHAIAETGYGMRFSSVIRQANVYGVQFHPEKSHTNGAVLLRNFATQIL